MDTKYYAYEYLLISYCLLHYPCGSTESKFFISSQPYACVLFSSPVSPQILGTLAP